MRRRGLTSLEDKAEQLFHIIILFIDKLRKSINRVQGAALVAVRNHKNIFWIDKE